MNSARLPTGSFSFDASTNGTMPMKITGSKSFAASYVILLYSALLMAITPVVAMRSV